MNSKVESCKGCIHSGTYMCTTTKDCINQSEYNRKLKDYSIVLDNYTTIKCHIKDRNPKIEILGSYTTSSHHSFGVEWTEINCGELKGYLLDRDSDIQLKNINEYYISDTEKGYGFYTKCNLVIIYFDLDKCIIAHKIHPRFDDSL